MRSVRRVGEAGTHPTSTDHVSGPIQTASNGETVGKNQVNSLYMYMSYSCTSLQLYCDELWKSVSKIVGHSQNICLQGASANLF